MHAGVRRLVDRPVVRRLGVVRRHVVPHQQTGRSDTGDVLLDHDEPAARLAAHAVARTEEQPLFSTTGAEMAGVWERTAIILQVPGPTCLYQLRHGGASDDLLMARRTEDEVMRRGQWRTLSSVRRYAKPGKVQRLLGSVPPVVKERGVGALESLPALLGTPSTESR